MPDPIPTLEEMVEGAARRSFAEDRPEGSFDEARPGLQGLYEASARRALTHAGVPELLERLAKTEAENRDLWAIAHVPTLVRERTQMRERLERYEAALREIADGDVPGEGDWADCVIAFARAALPSENSNDDGRD